MKSKPKYTVTENHFKKFKFYINTWKKNLGLLSWCISVKQGDTANIAETHFDEDISGKICTVIIPKYWSIEPTDKNLESVSIHELLHVLLYDLVLYARSHPLDQIGIMEKEHEVVNTLESILGHEY